MTDLEVSNGLVLPYAAVTIAGKGGAVGILLVTFMAVTSTLSAQIVAVSSIISFDQYRTYFKPHASDADVIRWSHFGVIIFAVVAAAFSTMLHYVGINLGWTLYMLGSHSLSIDKCRVLTDDRCLDLPRYFPDYIHHSLAQTEQGRGYHISSPRNGDWCRGLARVGSYHLRRCHNCYDGSALAVRVWHRRFRFLPDSVFRCHHFDPTSEL
jgi:hypothetical protein